MEFSLFSKQEYRSTWDKHIITRLEHYYLNSVPALLFFLEEKRKDPITQEQYFLEFFTNLSLRPDNTGTIIELTDDMILSSIKDTDFCTQYYNNNNNPFFISAIIGNIFNDSKWWEEEDITNNLIEFFS